MCFQVKRTFFQVSKTTQSYINLQSRLNGDALQGDSTNQKAIGKDKSLPIKFHQKLIDECLMILLFRVNELAADTSKQVKIFHKYNDRSLAVAD